MDSIDDMLYAAWKRVWPSLQDASGELLARRLSRRAMAVLTRPPRAWCVALRASDHRIASGLERPAEHRVTVTRSMLCKLTERVELRQFTLGEASQKLGTTHQGLTTARIEGSIRADYVPGLGGRRGKPVPLLNTDRELDPCARRFEAAEEAWGWTGKYVAASVPKDFEATLTRVPRWRGHVWKHQYDEDRHPELEPPAARRSQKLPEPVIDPCCWYKWSLAGHYLGNDPSNWRKDFDDEGLRPRRDLPKRKRRERRVAGREISTSQSQGSEHFAGFAWICPACGKSCGTAYLPVRRVNLLEHVQPWLAKHVAIKPKLEGFACSRCHGVNFMTRISAGVYWNELVSYLSGGLLYGHEVPRPAWIVGKRRNTYAVQVNRAPSKRQPQVIELLMRGMNARAIGAELGLTRSGAVRHLNRIYKEHGVHSRVELARKLGRVVPAQWVTKREKICTRLMAGMSYEDVAVEMGMTQLAVSRVAGVLRWKGVKVPYQIKRRAKAAVTS